MKKFIKLSLLYSLIVSTTVSLDIIRELVAGTGLSHSFWNAAYDWTPVVIGVTMLGVALAIFHISLVRHGVDLKKVLHHRPQMAARSLRISHIGTAALKAHANTVKHRPMAVQ